MITWTLVFAWPLGTALAFVLAFRAALPFLAAVFKGKLALGRFRFRAKLETFWEKSDLGVPGVPGKLPISPKGVEGAAAGLGGGLGVLPTAGLSGLGGPGGGLC